MMGIFIKTPTTVARAEPDERPNRITETPRPLKLD